MKKQRYRKIVVLALALLLAAAPLVVAAPGDLDPSFDGDGKATTDFGGNEDYGDAVVLDSTGRIVVAGKTGPYGSAYFGLVRYNPDGSLDTTLDADGRVITVFEGEDTAADVTLDGSGNIIAAGYTTSPITGMDFALARYRPDGTLDTAFDGDGLVTTDFGSAYDAGIAVAVDNWTLPLMATARQIQVSHL